jgi:hypothetical protein
MKEMNEIVVERKKNKKKKINKQVNNLPVGS